MAKAEEARLGTLAWRVAFERKLAKRARIAKLTQRRNVVVAPRFVDHNHGFYLHDGQDQLAWMLAAVAQAKRRIDVEAYIWEADDVGQALLAALVAAAQRGVFVRVLYDAVGSADGAPELFEPLVAAGGHVVEWNPVKPWRLRMSRIGRLQTWEPNQRDHRKLLVCDTTEAWALASKRSRTVKVMPPPETDGAPSAMAITGGRNIGASYLGKPLGKGQWRDCGVVLFGPVAPELGALFDGMWDLAEGEDTPPPALASGPIGDLAVLPLGSQPGLMNPLVWALSRIAAGVQEELRISCAYFVPTARWRRALAAVPRRSASCKIVIPLHNDVPVVAAASRHLLGALLRAGVEVYRYAAETLHEKTLIYDRAITVVGSSNLDQRSFKLNYELGVIVLGADFARPVVEQHDADLALSERYTFALWRDRPLWEKVVDWFWSLFRSQL
jgi:cardiolipin synthase